MESPPVHVYAGRCEACGHETTLKMDRSHFPRGVDLAACFRGCGSRVRWRKLSGAGETRAAARRVPAGRVRPSAQKEQP